MSSGHHIRSDAGGKQDQSTCRTDTYEEYVTWAGAKQCGELIACSLQLFDKSLGLKMTHASGNLIAACAAETECWIG
jgi:hypothetical protein